MTPPNRRGARNNGRGRRRLLPFLLMDAAARLLTEK